MASTTESLVAAWARLGAAALAASGDFWARSFEISARHLGAPGTAPGGWPAGLRRAIGELATVPGLALERFSTGLIGSVVDPVSTSDSEPQLIEGRPLLFPVRTMDAAQGMIIYPVAMERSQPLLDERFGGHFVAIDVGRGRAAVELYVMDYRVSDLGRYLEVGVGVFATPRQDPLALGLCVLEEPVNDPFACRAGIEAWGFPKSECTLDVEWRQGDCAWRATDSATGAPLLTLTLPRGGNGGSTDIPLRLYTALGGVPRCTVARRTGRGERMRAGGAGIALALHGATDAAPLLQTLRALDLDTAAPTLHGWTEHVSVEVGAPRPLAAAAGRPMA
jgi:hypothetical protein